MACGSKPPLPLRYVHMRSIFCSTVLPPRPNLLRPKRRRIFLERPRLLIPIAVSVLFKTLPNG